MRWARSASARTDSSETALGILQMMDTNVAPEEAAAEEGGPSSVLSSAPGLMRISSSGSAAVGSAVEVAGGTTGVVLRYDRRGAVVAVVRPGQVQPRVGDAAVLQPALGVRAPALQQGQVKYTSVADLLHVGERRCILGLPAMPSPPRRRPVSRRLPSGIAAAEVLMPLGEGHRIGLVGPPQAGKSTSAHMLVASQEAETAVVVAAQRPLPALQKLYGAEGAFKGAGVLVLHADPAKDPPGARYLLPLSALQIATQLRATHRHVLLVLDDVVAFNGAAAELGELPMSAPQIVAAALDTAGCVAGADGQTSALSVAVVLDLDPEEELDLLHRNLWRSVEPSLDVSLRFDAQVAANWILPAIDINQLLACGSAPVYQAPLLRLLRSELIGKLTASRALSERLGLGRQLGLHIEPPDQEDLDSDRVARALLAHGAPAALPELSVLIAAALVYHFPGSGKRPTRAAIFGFQEALLGLIRDSYPQLWETLSLLESLTEEQAVDVIQALGGVLLQHRFDFQLTRPMF